MSDLSDFSEIESDNEKPKPNKPSVASKSKASSLAKKIDSDKRLAPKKVQNRSNSAEGSENSRTRRASKKSIDMIISEKAPGTLSPPDFLVSNIIHDSKCFHPLSRCLGLNCGDEIYIAGGEQNGKIANPFNLIKFKPNTNFFNQIVPLSDIPTGRSGSSIVTIPLTENCNRETVFLFGGENESRNELNDSWVFDSQTLSWTDIKVSGEATFAYEDDYPTPRKGHAMTVNPTTGTVYIYGGMNKSTKDLVLNDGYSKTSDNIFTNMKMNTKSNCPPGRCGHSMIYYISRTKKNEFLYIFGGDLTGKGNGCNDLWCYSITSKRWKLLESTQGEKPPPRFNHSALMFDNRMWICGGECGGWFGNYGICDFYTYDFSALCWFKCNIGEKDLNYQTKLGPLVLFPKTRSLFIFGGQDSRGRPSSEVFRMSPLCTTVSIGAMRFQLQEMQKKLEGSSPTTDYEGRIASLEKKINKLHEDIEQIRDEETKTLQQMNDQLQVSEGLQKGLSSLQEVIKNKTLQDKSQFDRLSNDLKVVLQKMRRWEMRGENSPEID